MLELQLSNPTRPLGGEGVLVDDLTFYFLEGGRYNSTGENYNYIWYLYLELMDIYNNKINLVDSQFSASSSFHNYPVTNLNYLRGDSGWCTATGNNGNPNKSCWLKVSNINRNVSRVRLIGVDTGICRLISVETSGMEIARLDVRDRVTNTYPLAVIDPSLGSRPLTEIYL